MNSESAQLERAPLASPVTSLYGVGAERAAQLARLDIRTVEDLLLHRPHRYEDRRHLRKIAELRLQEPAITHGKVVASGLKYFRKRAKSIFELILDDGTARLHCRWWNLPYMEKYFAVGDEVLVFGKPLNLKPRTIDHPETEVLEGGEEAFIHLNRITPIYPLTEGLPQRWLRGLIWRTLQAFESRIAEPYTLPSATPSPAPQNLKAEEPEGGDVSSPSRSKGAGHETCPPRTGPCAGLPGRAQAVRMLHCPEKQEDAETARKRLALDEFIELQLQIQRRRRNFQTRAQALPAAGDNHLIRPFLAQLAFKLTPAQTKVLRELRHDMSARHPMRRLLQGDVGSGKTVVAACCALMALESGYDAALMAPTEILAQQHFLTFSRWLRPLGIPIELHTGSVKTTEPRDARVGARPGPRVPPSLTIGTHALIESGFAVDNLGLVIIDEQHKFGVAQREKLVRKGRYPHLLVMTATPIPRTLGLTLYGDLDISLLDELPPGRGQIRTFVRLPNALPKVYDFIRSKLAEGRQAYVVYPRVDETTPDGMKAVTHEFNTLQRLLSPARVALLHGRLQPREKEQAMTAFRDGSAKVLLATSLIEVGVDVPNATVMLIESAEAFGLAQLHQLRGRIGRGSEDSYCILVPSAKTKSDLSRLRVLEDTGDGFRIAEADLKMRGPGELLGKEQSGLPKLRFGDLTSDLPLIQRARQLAAAILETPGNI